MSNLVMTAGGALRMLLVRRRAGGRATKQPGSSVRAAIVLSSEQRRVWDLQRAEPESTAYALTMAWRIRGDVDVDRLEDAVYAVLETHDVLRTRYVDVDGSPVARIGGSDWAAWSSEPTTYAELAAEVSRPFDLATEPALRATLLEVEPDEHVLALRVHQIAADTWSLGILVTDLAAAYAGRPIARPALCYADVARWRAGVDASGDLAYWRRRLAGASVGAGLPADRPRVGQGPSLAATLCFTFEPKLASRIRALAEAVDVSVVSCLLAGLAVLCARCTGQGDVLLGRRVSGREGGSALATVVGPLASSLLLRTTLTAGTTGRQLVRQIQACGQRDVEHAGTPLEQLVSLIPAGRELGAAGTRPYRIQLVGTDVPEVVLDLPDLVVAELPAKATVIGVDLSVSVAGLDAGPMTATVTYNAELFDEATIALFSVQLQGVLAGLVANPDAEVHQDGRTTHRR